MILIICSSLICKTVVRVMGPDLSDLVGERSDYWPDKYTCPKCEQQATAAYEGEVDPQTFAGFTVIDLEAEEMFRALNGLGLPEEQDCRIEVLQKVLGTQKVKAIAGHTITGSTRFCLEWLEMEDGTKLYFGASSHGATVYRIVNKISYVKRVLEAKDVG